MPCPRCGGGLVKDLDQSDRFKCSQCSRFFRSKAAAPPDPLAPPPPPPPHPHGDGSWGQKLAAKAEAVRVWAILQTTPQRPARSVRQVPASQPSHTTARGASTEGQVVQRLPDADPDVGHVSPVRRLPSGALSSDTSAVRP